MNRNKLTSFLCFISSKLAAQFQSMEVRNTNFAAFIDVFTSNTYVMVIMSDPAIRKLIKIINNLYYRRYFPVKINYKQ